MRAKTKTTLVLTAAGGLIAGSLLFSSHYSRADRPAAKPPAPIAHQPTRPQPIPTPDPPPQVIAVPVSPKPVNPIVVAQGDGVIQLAILLDTSSSMDGLIDQARTQLWKIVNELAHAKKDGKRPKLQIAVYEYGNDGLAAGEGYLRMVIPFTDDLDTVSEKLFALSTNGGEEYAGHVLRAATRGLAWSDSPDAVKLIFIAGNEGFDQGDVAPAAAIAEARAKGIVVNTVFCGELEEGSRTGWRQGARLARGSFLNIDQNQKVVHIPAPQDDEIARLGVEMNGTYIAFGARGEASAARQSAQDKNSSADEGAVVARSVSKASGYYNNSGWDLVNAVANGKKVEEIDEADLPVAMRGMSKAERAVFVAANTEKRKMIQARINQLAADRDAFVAKKRMELGGDATSSLDKAMIAVVHEQGGRSGYIFE